MVKGQNGYWFMREKIRETLTETGTEQKKENQAVSFLDLFIRQGLEKNASDIHIEPFAQEVSVRMRIDGSMVRVASLDTSIHAALIARLKILGNMDIAERRIPQDGHIRLTVEGETVNMRISIIPMVFGEKAVIRLLSEKHVVDGADNFGMSRENAARFRRMLSAPSGLIYLTGPTGSGKTTTLYLVMEELAKTPVNIVTIEDPVEKNLSGVNQCQVNPQAGLTFDQGLRGLLRQDPDILMVGETRDRETAAISVRAAITGHRVFSTLHTRDTVSSIVRLEDMGIAPYLVADALTGVVAQRLLRKLCPYCARTVSADLQTKQMPGKPVKAMKTAAGCPRCNFQGYKGRTAVHEILVVDKTIRKMIAQGEDTEQIRKYAVNKQGMETLHEGGRKLVEKGITTVDEWMKAVYDEG